MALQLSALDALIGALATAYFGGMLAGQAYLLKHILAVQGDVRSLETRFERLRAVETAVGEVQKRLLSPERLTAEDANQEVR